MFSKTADNGVHTPFCPGPLHQSHKYLHDLAAKWSAMHMLKARLHGCGNVISRPRGLYNSYVLVIFAFDLCTGRDYLRIRGCIGIRLVGPKRVSLLFPA